MRRLVVAIDGPAGAGKSTVTRRVAAELDYTVVDTGALYRAVAFQAHSLQVSWDDAQGVGRVAAELAERQSIHFGEAMGGVTQVFLDGVDVSSAIRSAEMSQGASKVSAVPAVREALLAMQRGLGQRGGVVLEGRDIGTVVFPNAEAKFFLTASVDVRADRRYQEHLARGESAEFAEVRREVVERDARDSQRPIAPLKQAPDAMLVDSTGMSVDEVVAAIVARVRRLEASADLPSSDA